MADPRPEFVLQHNRRALLAALLTLAVMFGGWFIVVLVGENQNWTDDPGRWAVLPTFVWGLIGMVPAILLIAYCLALLIIREREPQIYRLEGVEGAAPTPSFLQPTETETSSAVAPEEAAPPPQS